MEMNDSPSLTQMVLWCQIITFQHSTLISTCRRYDTITERVPIRRYGMALQHREYKQGVRRTETTTVHARGSLDLLPLPRLHVEHFYLEESLRRSVYNFNC